MTTKEYMEMYDSSTAYPMLLGYNLLIFDTKDDFIAMVTSIIKHADDPQIMYADLVCQLGVFEECLLAATEESDYDKYYPYKKSLDLIVNLYEPIYDPHKQIKKSLDGFDQFINEKAGRTSNEKNNY